MQAESTMSDKVILVKYQRKRSSPKSNSATVMEDDSSPETRGEASLKPSYPKAEPETQSDNLKENNSVVPEIGAAKLAPCEGFPPVEGKSMEVPANYRVRDSVGVQCMQPNLAKIDKSKERPEDKLPERSPPSEPTSYVIHDNKGKYKCLKQLEDLFKELEGIKEDSSSSSNMEECGESKLNQMNCVWRNQRQQEIPFLDACRWHKSQISRSRGKLAMENSGVPAYEEQQHKAASYNSSSFVHTDFLDPSRTHAGTLNSDGPEVPLKDLRSGQSQSSFNFKNADHTYGRKMHNSFCESKRISPKWSEEELDSLWIGVRRYGQNNWNAILADSTLCFCKSRVVEDLADRWDREREILFSGMYSAGTRLPRPSFSPTPFVANPARNNHYSGKTNLPRYSNIQTFGAEASRPSGDSSYHQNETNAKATIPHSAGVIMATPISYRAPPESPSLGITPLRSSCQKSDDTDAPRQRNQSPPNSSTPTRRRRKTSNTQQWVLGLPALNSAQMRSRQRVSPLLKSCNPPAPPATVFPRHGHEGVLKRKNVKVSENAAPVDEAWLRKRLCVSPNAGLTFQKPTSDDDSGGHQKDSNLVVTGAGDSSEDTISDH